jgi:hypothetical protein
VSAPPRRFIPKFGHWSAASVQRSSAVFDPLRLPAQDPAMSREITRRDFLDGMALTVGAAAVPGVPSLAEASASAAYYPPALTGMRGSTRRPKPPSVTTS